MNSKILGAAVLVLVFAVILSSSLAVLYYNEYLSERSSNQNYIAELQSADFKYNQTASGYNSLANRFNSEEGHYNNSVSSYQQLAATFNSSASDFDSLSESFGNLSQQYNETISLLANSLEVLNTSTPAYISASSLLSGLWENYSVLVSNYEQDVSSYNSLTAKMIAQSAEFGSSNNVSLKLEETPAKSIPISLLSANFLIDFGNGSRVWYNDTSTQPGWNLYIATLVITDGNVNATWYPSYGEHLVNGILGKTSSGSRFWFAWSLADSKWELSSTGADQVTIYNGSSYAWSLCDTNSSFLPTCPSP